MHYSLWTSFTVWNISVTKPKPLLNSITKVVYTTTPLGSLTAVSLLVIILNAEKLFEFIDDCENIINISECKIHFFLLISRYLFSYLNQPHSLELNLALKYSSSDSSFNEPIQFEQKFSRILFFVLLKLTPFFVLVPWMIHSYLIHFTTDSAVDAFELPFPSWWVWIWINPFLINFIKHYAFDDLLRTGYH